MTLATIVLVMTGFGSLLSGVAAVVSLIVRRRVVQLHKEVNGQTRLLVTTTHALGVAEGIASERDAQDAAPNGAPV